MARKFFLVAGHGGSDPGAVSGLGFERDENERIVREASELLRSQELPNTTLIVLPFGLSLREKIDLINKNLADPSHDLAVEIHHNSNVGQAGTGTEAYFGNKQLADEMREEAVKVLGLRDRGSKDGSHLAFNRDVHCASAILEVGFVNNKRDIRVSRGKGGLAVARGVVRASGGSWADPDHSSGAAPVSDGTLQKLIMQLIDLLQRLLSTR